MIATILTLVAGLVSIVLWWLNNTPSRRHERVLDAIRTLQQDYAKALASGDALAVATCQRRLRELAAEANYLTRK